jgi:hypothetical protein
VCATISEAGIVVAFGVQLMRRAIGQSTAPIAPILAGGALLAAHLPHLMLLFWLL